MILSLLFLSILFVLSVLSVVIIGILGRELIHKNTDRGVYFFLFFYLLFLVRLILNIYFAFFNPERIIFTKLNVLFDLLPVIFAIFIFHSLKHRLHNFFVRGIMISMVVLVLMDVLFFFVYTSVFGAFNLIGLGFFFIFFYLMTIKFLNDWR